MRKHLSIAIAVMLAAMFAQVRFGRAALSLINLAPSATGGGTTPSVSLSQGSAAGLSDGSMFTWFGGATSPRTFSGTNLQPYLTWSSDQDVRHVRMWFDTNATNSAPFNLDRVAIDTLVTGGNAANDSDWQARYDSGTGIASVFVDVDLGSVYTTRGVRVRAYKPSGDINVGELAVFGPQHGGGSITSHRVTPTSFSSSSSRFRPDSQAFDGNWNNSWLSETTANNPGSNYTLTQNFATPTNLTAISVTWAPQPGFADVPGTWAIEADLGAGFVPIGTYTEEITGGVPRLQYYVDLGNGLINVSSLRLVVAESAMPGANGPAVVEFEALNLPEPVAAAALVMPAIFAARTRRRPA